MKLLVHPSAFVLVLGGLLLTGCPRDKPSQAGAVTVRQPDGFIFFTSGKKLYKCEPSGQSCTSTEAFPSEMAQAVYSDADGFWWAITSNRVLQYCSSVSTCTAVSKDNMPEDFGTPTSLAATSSAVVVVSATGKLARCEGDSCVQLFPTSGTTPP